MENIIRLKKRVRDSLSFFKDVGNELKKVRWPNHKELIGYTAVVLMAVSVLAVFFALIDLALSQIVELILG